MSDDDESAIADCLRHQDDLTEWECTFLQSIEERVGDGRELSDRQGEILERIVEKLQRKGLLS